MGTNYYLKTATKPPCECCGRPFESPSLHIGKSSAGWCFSLHVMPEDGINSLDDWKGLFASPGVEIVDEHGDTVSAEDMLKLITERSWGTDRKMGAQWYAENYAELGPNGLARHKIDGRHCIAHGKGTYDLIRGVFS